VAGAAFAYLGIPCASPSSEAAYSVCTCRGQLETRQGEGQVCTAASWRAEVGGARVAHTAQCDLRSRQAWPCMPSGGCPSNQTDRLFMPGV
jgi:hypothetical protein